LLLVQVYVERRPAHAASLGDRLAKYSNSNGNNFTAANDPDLGRFPELITHKVRSTQPTDSKQENEKKKEDNGLMSERVSGSQNERIRRQFVHLPEQNGARSLWWSSSHETPDDRILAQMRHVPRNYRRDEEKLKTIYMPAGLGNEPDGREKFIVEKCPVNNCRLTSDRAVALTADLRLLQSDAFFHPNTRKPPGQIWAIFLLESPANTGVYAQAKDFINWTATYRWDSTLVTPYEKFVPYPNATRLLQCLS